MSTTENKLENPGKLKKQDQWVKEQKENKKIFSISTGVFLILSLWGFVNWDVKFMAYVWLIFGGISGYLLYMSLKDTEEDYNLYVKDHEQKTKAFKAQQSSERRKKAKAKKAVEDTEKRFNERIKEKAKGDLAKFRKLVDDVALYAGADEVDVSSYKLELSKHEPVLVEKGGDPILSDFMKVASFIDDLKNSVKKSWVELDSLLDYDDLAERRMDALIEEYTYGLRKMPGSPLTKNLSTQQQILVSTRKAQDRMEWLMDMKGKDTLGAGSEAEYKCRKLLKSAERVDGEYEKQVKSILFYHAMAHSMLVFYVQDKKIKFFEIREAFEKLGAFDSTWQKNMNLSLQRVEDKLDMIGAGLVALNDSFNALHAKQDEIISEINNLNAEMSENTKATQASNALHAIQIYQTYKFAKAIK